MGILQKKSVGEINYVLIDDMYPVFSGENGTVVISTLGGVFTCDTGYTWSTYTNKNRRFFFLEKIVNNFFDLLLNERGEVLATLKLSHAISDSEKADIAKKLDDILKKKIKISFSVDPSLLVGSILQIGSTMIDTSAKTKLNNLFNK